MPPDHSDVTWLAAALFVDGAQDCPITPGSTGLVWARLPVRGVLRRLVPIAPRFAVEAFTNRHDAMSRRRLLAGQAVRQLVRTGGLSLGPTLRANPDQVLDDPDRSVIAAAAQALDTRIAGCAITLGPRRYNRKPVVQLFDEHAATVGFLKVGADAATSAMVEREVATLQDVQPRESTSIVAVPKVLWHGSFDGRSVACFSPVGRQGALLAPDNDRRVQLVRALLERTGSHEVRAHESAPVVRLLTAKPHQTIVDLVERTQHAIADTPVKVARWHGDFSPWNMITTADHTALIDWEFSSDDMPLGADLLHHRVMVATHLREEPASQPLGQLVDSAEYLPELSAVDVRPSHHWVYLALYLLELIRRDTEFTPAAIDALEQLLRSFGHQ